MNKDYDEVTADMLIQLDGIEKSLERLDARMEKADKRTEMTIKRMVKAEARLEASEKRMELFDKKLEQSIQDQKEFSHVQSLMNKYFLDVIKKNGK